MRFAEPQMLHFLWALPVILLALLWSAQRRRRLLLKFADAPLLRQLAPEASGGRRMMRGLLLLVSIGLVIVAAARPQWGRIEEEVKQVGVDVVLVVDTSLSMLAEDVKPSRLQRARVELKEFLRRMRGDRGSLVVFSSTAHVLVPLTLDTSVIEMFLDVLDTEITSGRGTAVADALEAALEAFPEGEGNNRAVILVSDGEDHGTSPVEVAKRAAERGIVIHTVGVGTTQGEPIPIRDPFSRSVIWKMDEQGRVVTSRLEETSLREIASMTGGRYIRLGPGGLPLARVYDDIANMDQNTFDGRKAIQYRERFQWPLTAGVFLLLARVAVSDARRRGGRRQP